MVFTMPKVIMEILFDPSYKHADGKYRIAYFITSILVVLNHSMNFYLLLLSSKLFRKGVRDILGMGTAQVAPGQINN